MKLSDALFRWKKALPRGNIWRGKYRLVKPVTHSIASKKKTEYELEERNMFYLRNPYLNAEQSFCHAKSFNHKQKYFEKITEFKLKSFRSHRLLGDRFGFLKVADKWE